MDRYLMACAAAAISAMASNTVLAADTYQPECFKPWNEATKTLQFPKKQGPFRVALVNGFAGNAWRVQMIKSLQAYAEQPDVKPLIRELNVISTGTDVAAQIAAVDNFINSGTDIVLLIAVNPTSFKPVIRRAQNAGTILVPFDNILDSDQVLQVNEDQTELGRLWGRWLLSNMGPKGRVLEVRGVPGNSVDRDIHAGFREVLDPHKDIEVVEVVGNWDDATGQKVVADAIRVQGHFDGMMVQAGTTGPVRALIESHHPFIPVGGQLENGYRKLVAEHSAEGLKGLSTGQSPALVAVALKAGLAAAQGERLPQLISAPIPHTDYSQLKPGVNYFPDLADSFFTDSNFPACGIALQADALDK